MKDAIRDGEVAETEIEILFLGWGRGNKPNQRPFQNANQGFTSLLLSSLWVLNSESAEQNETGLRVIAGRGRRWA